MVWLIVLIGLFLRLVFLNQSLWLDEAVQAITSQGSLAGVFAELRGDFHPPLFHLLMWLWVHLFGSSEIVLRLPSVIFGTATIYVVYLIGKVISDLWLVFGDENKSNQSPVTSHQSLPLLAAIFMATAPFHIYYSQEARTYAMTAFFAGLSMYWFMKLVGSKERGVRRLQTPDSRLVTLAYVLSTALLLYSDYFGPFILLTQVLASLIFLRKKITKLLNYYLLVLLLFLPWLPMLLTQIQVGRQATQALPGWGRLVNVNFIKALPLTFIKFSIGRITIFNKKLYAAIAGILFLIYGGIIGKVIGDQWSVIRRKKKLDTDYWLLVTIFWLIVPILSAWLISLFIPNYQPFRLLLVLPAFYLLLAYGAFRFPTTMIYIIVAIILGVNLISLRVYYFNSYFHKEDWRGVVRYIETHGAEDSAAILPSETSGAPWKYYSSGKVRLIGIASGVKKVTQEDLNNLTIQQFNNLPAGGQGKTIFYIRYLVPLFDSQERISTWLAENGFVKIKEISFNQIPLWIYQRLEGS